MKTSVNLRALRVSVVSMSQPVIGYFYHGGMEVTELHGVYYL
jgi:hypothetical protein